jgi:hypothetical protein
MSLDLLLVAFVREASSLLAAAATHRGARTSLAHLSDRLFHGLAQELQALDVRRRVSADMLGMVPRAYLRKVARLEESITDRGRCLWEACYDYIAAQGSVSHAALQERFHRDDQDVLRGVLSDLRHTGAILTEGRGAQIVYRKPTGPEIEAHLSSAHDGTEDLIWTFIHHDGPVSRSSLLRYGVKAAELERALEQLIGSGRVREDGAGEQATFSTVVYSIPVGAGWEGAILDHFHAVVRTLGTILKYPEEPSAASTYKLDLWPGHPMAEEAKDLFRDWRRRATALRERVDAYNATVDAPAIEPILLYSGLCKGAAPKARERPSE